MHRHFATIAVAVTAALAGCASTAPSPSLIERDPVDGLIAQNAAAATQALRELSEASGGSRVVNSKPSAASARPVAEAAPNPLPPATTIAARKSFVAVDPDYTPAPKATSTPTAAASAAPASVLGTPMPTSSGVVVSGGLLSAPPPGLERLMTVRWTGELEQLLARVAQESGWKLRESSGLRVAPVIISISADNRSAFDILRDIGAIAGQSADIMVSATTKTISVRYPQR